MAAIHLLDDDILLLVFLTSHDNANPSFKTTLSLSHVCSRWRALTVEHCPELWRVHALRVPRSPDDRQLYESGKLSKLNKELIRRSHSLDLEFSWYEEVLPSPSAFGALLEAANQLGSLELLYPGEQIYPYDGSNRVLPGMETARAPRLKHLELVDFGDGLTTSIFCNGELPSLRSLSMMNTGLDIHEMKFAANLKNIRVTGAESYLSSWPTILQHTPQLTTLCLDLFPDGIPPSLEVNLPHLVDLDITAPIASLHPFLSRFSLPACRKVKFNTHAPDINLGPSISTAQFIRETATRYSIDTPSGSRLRVQSGRTDTRVVFILSPATNSEDAARSSDYNIHLTVTKPSTPVLSEWLCISGRITSLSIPAYLSESQQSVSEFIRSAESLRTVTCTPGIAQELGQELGGTEYNGIHTSIFRSYPNVMLVLNEDS